MDDPSPIPISAQQYEDPRADLDFADLHRRARGQDPGLGQSLLRAAMWPPCKLLWRVRHEGRDNIPATGQLIVAANHASAVDHFFVGLGIPRPVNFMAKSQLFNAASRTPLNLVGAYPVRRGARDEDAHMTSMAILARGGVVVMYPQGGRTRTDAWGGAPRRGVARLAYESGAAVLPTAVIGSAQVREWRRARFPQVIVRYGEPMTVTRDPAASREKQQALAEEIMAVVRSLYDARRDR